MFNNIKSKKILQTMVDYEQYQDLSKKNMLPMLISVSEDQQKDATCIADLEQLYIKSPVSYQLYPDSEKELYVVCPNKLKRAQIRVGHFVHHDSTVSKILNMDCGDLDMNYGGFYFKTGYRNLDDLSHEVVDLFRTRQK